VNVHENAKIVDMNVHKNTEIVHMNVNENAKIVHMNVRHGGQKVTKNAEIGYTKTGPKMPKWVRLMPRARGADVHRIVARLPQSG